MKKIFYSVSALCMICSMIIFNSCKKNPVIPTLTTSDATNITVTSLTSGGNITNDGGSMVTASGICYGTTTGPTTADTHTTDGSLSGSFVSKITGLTQNTIYYIRAYATNNVGTSYGNEVTATTSPVSLASLTTTAISLITINSAVSGGDISSGGNDSITVRGVCWAIATGPTTANDKTTDGVGTGNFVSNLTGLLPGVIYYVRAYATNSAGTAYGDELSFTTLPLTVPTVTTAIVTPGLTTAVTGGNITVDGGSPVTDKGVCWATTTNPSITDSKTSNGTGSDSFISNITVLTSGTTYYVRAYATNSQGTAYGNQIIFSTKIADVDGNTYKTVTIGTQIWMAENLKTTKFNDITLIPLVTDNTAWGALTSAAYCWYANDQTTNKPIYGAIYNFYTVKTGKLCPAGWHVPTDADYQTLEQFLGMDLSQLSAYEWRGTDQGAQMKNTTGWATGMNGTNTSGWSALPGGYRYGPSGVFNDIGQLGYWWTSSADPINAFYRRLDGADSTGVVMNKVYRSGVVYTGGKYIRCVK